MKYINWRIGILAIAILALEAHGQTTTLTYQGRLVTNGIAAEGLFDMSFALFAGSSGGSALASQFVPTVPVTNGVFTAKLDFSDTGFPGADRWLEIQVATPGGAFSLLAPRQRITSAPYAIRSLSSATAASVSWSTITDMPAGFADGIDNDTTYLAGAGLTLNGNQFNVSYGGNGTSNSAARSDHTHYGAAWTGSAAKGISITTSNSNTGSAAIYGRHLGGTGISYLAPAAIWGDGGLSGFGLLGTGEGTAILGFTTGAIGVNGVDMPGSTFNPPGRGGVFGESQSGYGVAAFSDSSYGLTASSQSSTAIFGQAATGTPLILNRTATTAGDIAIFRSNFVNKARIDASGRGYFNGGTQASGADVAEAFAVSGDIRDYKPGDVLVLSTTSSMRVEKSSVPYSSLVAGVYATKPGMLLTDREIDVSLDDTVPMGVVGIIPKKVNAENGPIRIGDLLVTSSSPGRAMKGTDRLRMPGAIIGKALENFSERGEGTIKVLVNVK